VIFRPILLAMAAATASAAAFAPAAARADWVNYSSRVSEVDACNQAQYLVPQGATVTTMKVRQFTDKQGYGFTCKVKWSQSPKAQPTRMPILFGPVWS
jgi:ABC-type nitrate/sulfonate/bicarbonate transport system substrate-binding protein